MTSKLINWNESYSVNHPEMDKQHQKLIEIINTLFDYFKEGKAQEIISEILREVIDYANFHLNSEEKLLNKYNYPLKESHIKKHRLFKEKIEEFKTLINSNANDAHYKLIEYLKDWWENHILIEDMQYANFLQKIE
jgi:hemerythrin